MLKKDIYLEYSVKSTTLANLSEQLAAIRSESRLSGALVVRIVIFCGCNNNEEYVARQRSFVELVKEEWGDSRPIVTYVSQPTLGAEMVIETHCCRLSGGESVEYKSYDCAGRSISVERDFGRQLFVGELTQDILNTTFEEQANGVFELLKVIFEKEGVVCSDIVRQWNYIERITQFEGENEHYALFNKARSDFYSTSEWVNGYPAATGIGCECGGVVIDIDCLEPKGDCVITPIDNKLQVAAHVYSHDVLESANLEKPTPKFERAKSVEASSIRKLVYVSGTAAIRGELSLAGSDSIEQTQNTLENIDELISDRDTLSLLRVYVKRVEDYRGIESFLSATLPDVATIYLHSDVCRDELLVEIEGISIE